MTHGWFLVHRSRGTLDIQNLVSIHTVGGVQALKSLIYFTIVFYLATALARGSGSSLGVLCMAFQTQGISLSSVSGFSSPQSSPLICSPVFTSQVTLGLTDGFGSLLIWIFTLCTYATQFLFIIGDRISTTLRYSRLCPRLNGLNSGWVLLMDQSV